MEAKWQQQPQQYAIYGTPLKGISHYEVIERMADICQKHNLNYEVEEIFAAQNKNRTQHIRHSQ